MAVCLGALAGAAPWARAQSAPLGLQPGDRVVVVGNTFAERMRHFGYFESLLTVRFPELGLTFRNLGWSADEVDLQPRPLDFGGMDMHLADQAASVILLSFGFNESFKGEPGLGGFVDAYGALIDHLAGKRFDGRAPARPVVITPLPTEPLPKNLPSPSHEHLGPYSKAIRELAGLREVPVIDLSEGVPAYRDAYGVEERFTFNGIHLSEVGDWHVAWAMLAAMGLEPRASIVRVQADSGMVSALGAVRIEPARMGATGGQVSLVWDRLPAPPPPAGAGEPPHESLRMEVKGLQPGAYRLHWGGAHAAEFTAAQLAEGVTLSDTPAHAAAEALRQLVIEKNGLFFDRWRAVNGYYIYGGRKHPFGIVSFPPEMERFDELVLERERDIHALASQPVKATLTIEAVTP